MVHAYLIVWQVPPTPAEKLLGGQPSVVDAGIYKTKTPSPAPVKNAIPTLGAEDTGETYDDARLSLHLSLMKQVPELKSVIMMYPTYKRQVEEHALLGRAREAIQTGEMFRS